MNAIKKAAQGAVAIIILSGAAAIAAPNVANAVAAFTTTTRVSGTGSVYCPTGTRVTGGGAKAGFASFGRTVAITASYPTSNGWTAKATQTDLVWDRYAGEWEFKVSSATVTVYAVCVR